MIIVNEYVKSNYGHNKALKYLRLKKVLKITWVSIKWPRLMSEEDI